MKKKIISAILAGACAVSAMGLSVSAATAGNKNVTSQGEVKLSATGSLLSVTINVSVPSAIAAFINPFGVEIENPNGANYTTAGVQSIPYQIINQTTSNKIKVEATPSLTVATATSADDKKSVYPLVAVVSTAGDVEDDKSEGFVVMEGDDINEKAEAAGVKDPEYGDITVYKAIFAEVVGKAAANPVELKTSGEDANATKTTKNNVDTYTVDATKLADELSNLASDSAKRVTFVDQTVTKAYGVQQKSATELAAELTPGELFTLDKATDATHVTYGTVKINGAVTENGGKANWDGKEKVTFTVVFNLQVAK